MKTIDEDIKNGQFKTCYLLYGEEEYLKKQYKDKLVKALTVPGDTLNFTRFQGKEAQPGELIDLAETLPFLAERRVILVEDSGFFKTACDMLADYLPQINPSTTFIFSETDVDKRSRAYKQVKKAGSAVAFEAQNEDLITRWILGRIGKENKKITRQVLQMFLTQTGLDMSLIDRELEKLLCYTMGRDVITAEDVAAVVTVRAENHIFEMVDAIATHDQTKALKLYDDLLALKEPPMRILYLITRQFRILMEVKEMSRLGYPQAEIAKKVSVPAFAVRKYQAQAKGFTGKQLRAALEDGAQAEEQVKTGRLDEKIAVEIFLIRYSTKKELR